MTDARPGAPAFRIKPVWWWLLSSFAVAVAFLVASPLLQGWPRLIVGTLNALLTALAIGSQPKRQGDDVPQSHAAVSPGRYGPRPPGTLLCLVLCLVFTSCSGVPSPHAPSSECAAAVVHAAVVCGASIFATDSGKCQLAAGPPDGGADAD